MTSRHHSKRQRAFHAKTSLTPDPADGKRKTVSVLYATWLSQKAKIEGLLRSGPASNDFTTRSLHDDTIGVEVDARSTIETEIEKCAEASPTAAIAKVRVALDQAVQEFGSEPSLSWQMVTSALGDLQLIEARAAA